MPIILKADICDLDNWGTEQDLEEEVYANYRLLYGDQSIIFGKSKIKTLGGSGTIPNAFILDLEGRRWWVVEVEMLSHGLGHIVSQVTRMFNAATTAEAKHKLRRDFVDEVGTTPAMQKLFADAGIPQIQISTVIEEILSQEPAVSIPIDAVSEDLLAWARTTKYTIDLHVVERFRSRNTGDPVIKWPDLVDLSAVGNGGSGNSLKGEALIMELLTKGLFQVNEELSMTYKGRNFKATVEKDGRLKLDDGRDLSPNQAAIQSINELSNYRKNVNSLTVWKNRSGETLVNLRKKLPAGY